MVQRKQRQLGYKERQRSSVSLSFRTGDRVEVNSNGAPVHGFVKKKNGDKTYCVILDNGLENSITKRKSIRPVEMTQEDYLKACANGLIDAIQAYAKAGGDINFQDKKGTTGLELACINAHYELVEFLLESSALVTPAAFLEACRNGLKAVAEAFLAGGGDPGVPRARDGGEGALELALAAGTAPALEVAALLLEASPSPGGGGGGSGGGGVGVSLRAFAASVEAGFAPAVRRYLERERPPACSLGRAFDAAFKHGHIEVMSLAVRHRALGDAWGAATAAAAAEAAPPATGEGAAAAAAAAAASDLDRVTRHQIASSFEQRLRRHQLVEPDCSNDTEGAGVDGAVGFGDLSFLRAEDFVKQGRFLPHEEAARGGLLVAGGAVAREPDACVLALVHPWDRRDPAQEHRLPFQQAADFIAGFPEREGGGGRRVDYVWFEGSCCPQPGPRRRRRTRLDGSIRAADATGAGGGKERRRRRRSPSAASGASGNGGGGGGGDPGGRAARALPLALLRADAALALPRMMVFEGYDTRAKEKYNKYRGLVFSDIDDLLSDALCHLQILLAITSGSKTYCLYYIKQPHQLCFCNVKRWDREHLAARAVAVRDEPYVCPDVERPPPGANVWLRSAGLGAAAGVRDQQEKRQLWYGVLHGCWFQEIADPTVTLAKCVLGVADLHDNDPALLRRLWAYGLTEEDTLAHRLTVMDEEGQNWDLSFDNIMAMLGTLRPGRDPVLTLNSLLLTLAFLMGKEPSHAPFLEEGAAVATAAAAAARTGGVGKNEGAKKGALASAVHSAPLGGELARRAWALTAMDSGTISTDEEEAPPDSSSPKVHEVVGDCLSSTTLSDIKADTDHAGILNTNTEETAVVQL